MAAPNPLALAAGYSDSSDSEDEARQKKAKEEKPKEDSHRPGFGRGYFADDGSAEASGGPSSTSRAPGRTQRPAVSSNSSLAGKKRPLPKSTDLMNSNNTPGFIAHTMAAKKEEMYRLRQTVNFEERPMEEVTKKKGLMDVFEEKKLKHKAVASKYHVPASEIADFVEPVRVRVKAVEEKGDIGWLEVFARASKRSSAAGLAAGECHG
eukprot:CAMPEP_0173066782 /NCGR_PEP_ID=MMETSP1102-20130122/6410_1 /TAXON_ID=49646 /ORGANISM="Geminigera sp., Strain Caron Lab Isolate" /LENGTH=207 /DNA_ID=CAMNT_0013934293 /DNA_START=30 /DNA_END=653 /DNA_ORIENTATION=+